MSTGSVPALRVRARKVRAVLGIARDAGLDPARLLADLGADPAALADPEGWVPQSLWADLWRAVERRTGDPAVGLHAAERVGRGYFGVLDYLVRASPTLGDAAAAAARYFRLANTHGELDLSREGGCLVVSRRIAGDESLDLPRSITDFALASMVRTFRLAASGWTLAAVEHRHPAPADDTAYKRFFQCPVRFGAPRDALHVPEAHLGVPMREPDAELRALVETHARALLAEIPAAQEAAAQVRAALAPRLQGGAPDVDAVAAALACSRRTLQRRLAEEGTSFQAVLDALRADLARRYLRDPALGVGEVAWLLGFSEISAFHRAFRRWTGQGPAAWRAALARGVNGSAPQVMG